MYGVALPHITVEDDTRDKGLSRLSYEALVKAALRGLAARIA